VKIFVGMLAVVSDTKGGVEIKKSLKTGEWLTLADTISIRLAATEHLHSSVIQLTCIYKVSASNLGQSMAVSTSVCAFSLYLLKNAIIVFSNRSQLFSHPFIPVHLIILPYIAK